MINHFRTLLLNLPRAGEDEEFISAKFAPVVLTIPLTPIFQILFPPAASRQHKVMLVQTYLNLIQSTDFRAQVLNYDPRITYDLADSQYFQINNISVPANSDSNFPILITGNPAYNMTNPIAKDTLQVRQIGSSFAIVVTSQVTNTILYEGILTFTNGTSNTVTIPTYNIQFAIAGQNFTATTNKTWTFDVEMAYQPDILATYVSLSSGGVAGAMFNYNRSQCNSMYEALWVQHFNTIYKLTGLLLGYVERVNLLYV